MERIKFASLEAKTPGQRRRDEQAAKEAAEKAASEKEEGK